MHDARAPGEIEGGVELGVRGREHRLREHVRDLVEGELLGSQREGALLPVEVGVALGRPQVLARAAVAAVQVDRHAMGGGHRPGRLARGRRDHARDAREGELRQGRREAALDANGGQAARALALERRLNVELVGAEARPLIVAREREQAVDAARVQRQAGVREHLPREAVDRDRQAALPIARFDGGALDDEPGRRRRALGAASAAAPAQALDDRRHVVVGAAAHDVGSQAAHAHGPAAAEGDAEWNDDAPDEDEVGPGRAGDPHVRERDVAESRASPAHGDRPSEAGRRARRKAARGERSDGRGVDGAGDDGERDAHAPPVGAQPRETPRGALGAERSGRRRHGSPNTT